MNFRIFAGILIPFLGTAIGAGIVFLGSRRRDADAGIWLSGFAAGVMTAASVWSLLIPAIELASLPSPWQFLPAVLGLFLGGGFMMSTDRAALRCEAAGKKLHRNRMMYYAVTLHNLPEGMAVGVIFSGFAASEEAVPFSAAMALTVGIAIQNIPEGAILSLPLAQEGQNRFRAFLLGVLSGACEPCAAIITFFAAGLISPAMPILLGFAAGAMLFVTVKELTPAFETDRHPYLASVAYLCGFSAMMILDVALG